MCDFPLVFAFPFGGCVDLGISSIELISTSLVRVNYSVDVITDAAFYNVNNYTVTGTQATIRSILPVYEVANTLASSSSYSLIELNPLIPGETYTFSVSNLTSRYGNVISSSSSRSITVHVTKVNSSLDLIPSHFNKNPGSMIHGVLSAIAISDELIGGAFNYTIQPMNIVPVVPLGTLNLATVGITCVRASDAWRQIGLETNGSIAFLNKVTSNIARWQSRDGMLQRLFVEGSRTNLILRSGTIDNAAWMPGNAAATANYSPAPDGTTTATRITCTSGGSGRNQSPAIVQPGYFAASAFCKAASPQSGMLVQGQAAVVASAPSLTTDWQRTYTSRFKTGEVAIEGVFLSDGRNWSGVGGITAGARDWIWWGAQLEAAVFSSSYIETAGSSAMRAADLCTVTNASVPSWIRGGKYALTVAPECTSTQLISHATEMTLLAFGTGTTDRVSLVLDAGAIKVRVIQGGAIKVTSGGITFSRWQDLTITLDSSIGAVTISGATTGNGTTTGTSWAMQSGDLYLGTTSTGTTPYYGEIDYLISEVA